MRGPGRRAADADEGRPVRDAPQAIASVRLVDGPGRLDQAVSSAVAPRWISILRGFAVSASGMRTARTPSV